MLLCVGVGFLPSLVFIDQLRFLDDLPDAAKADALVGDVLGRPAFRLSTHVVVGVHLGLCPLEKDVLEPHGFGVIPQGVPLVLGYPAKSAKVIAVDAHILLEGDLDAGQLSLGGGCLDAG